MTTVKNFSVRPGVITGLAAGFAFTALAQATPPTPQSDVTFPSGAEIAAMSDAERHQWAAKTEVWQPVPPVVTVAADDTPSPVPSDALVLLGKDGWQAHWQPYVAKTADKTTDKKQVQWLFADGVGTVKPGAGDIETKDSFCDIQLHLEWRTPAPDVNKTGQLRNNSGIFLQDKYEIQILDSYQNATYPNGQAGAVYKQTIPLANATRPPLQWQKYDIIYKAPRFDGANKISSGTVTVLHNGVLVQNHTEIAGTTEWIGPPQNPAHGCAPLKLQDHGDAVSFRNIWLRRL